MSREKDFLLGLMQRGEEIDRLNAELASLRSRLALLERVADAVRDDGGRYGVGTSWCVVDTLRQAVSQTDDVYNVRLLCAADRIEAALRALDVPTPAPPVSEGE
jgi:hypothetical protein